MAETWTCTIESAAIVKLGHARRVVRLSISVAVIDEGGAELNRFPFVIDYPPAAFRGLTNQQAARLVRVDGVGEIPPLEELAANVLADWRDGDALRRIEPGTEFGPR
jgi:hypothetical protein